MFIWFLGIVGWIVGSFMVGQIVFWIGLLLMPIFTFLLVYTKLAPKDMIFTFVKEATAIIVMRGDQFDKIIISYKDHVIDPNTWDVIERRGAKTGFFGGLKFWGIPPFQKIGRYSQRWSHLLEDGTVKSHDEKLSYVLLKKDFYVFEIPITEKNAAQDINGISVDVKLVVPIRIVNPYEALFLPQRWLAAISGMIKPVLKRFVAKFRYKEDLLDMMAGRGIELIQEEKGIVKKGTDISENKMGDDLKERFWEELRKVFPDARVQGQGEEENLRIYGVLLEKKGTDIFEIDTSEEYRKMVTAEYQAKQEAKKTKISGEAEGEAIANRIIIPMGKIAKQLAGVKKSDEKLTKENRKEITSRMEQASSILLRREGIAALKPTDKVVVIGKEGVGQTIAGDTVRETIRKEAIAADKKETE